jgi:hypothetical protein
MTTSALAALALAATLAGCAERGAETGAETGAGTGTADPAEPTRAASPAAPPSAAKSPVESSSPEDAPASASEGASADPTVSASDSASADPSPEESMKISATGFRGKLLPSTEMPGFNEQFTWRERRTRGGEGRMPFGTCQKFAMTSIGATKVAVRTFRPGTESPGSAASNLVAEFADEMTAKRAYEVLRSWREQCKDQLAKYTRSTVGKLQSVPVEGGVTGDWYLLVYGPAGDPDSAYFDAQGMTRSGKTISMVELRLVGQDYNYPRGQEPMVDAVQKASDRIG